MNGSRLKGKILGFEEYENYQINEVCNDTSPFRILHCVDSGLSFLVVNPFFVKEDYNFEVDDGVMKVLKFQRKADEDIAVLCIVKLEEENGCVNLRSPLIINTKEGIFAQIILQDEQYHTSVPFLIRRSES
jgi:flagellar assembly factor FliW